MVAKLLVLVVREHVGEMHRGSRRVRDVDDRSFDGVDPMLGIVTDSDNYFL